jgi:secreted trypsin-like serine protease
MDGKPGQYGVTDVYTRVGSYVEWIDAVFVGRQPPR